MKITFILSSYPWKPVGGFKVVYEYANHLVARGHEVTVVHPHRLPNWSIPSQSNIFSWLRIKGRYLKDSFFVPSVKWQLIDERVKMLFVREPTEDSVPDGDAIFATWWPTAELVLKYPSNKGRKFYLVQDFYPLMADKSDLENSWRLPLRKVIISFWLYNMVIASNVPLNNVTYIPNGIDNRRFRIIKEIDKRPKKVAMMYGLANFKAADDGVMALKLCKIKEKQLKAICFGAGPRPKSLPNWIEYESNVTENRLIDIYNSSSIFISSSLLESFALPPAEAMACGCAAVCTDSGGILEYARHESNALLSPPGNPELLSQNLLRVLVDDNLRISLAKEGHKSIQEFTWARSTDKLEKFLNQK